jgi:quinol-cytochrome oxidoreductase complex cytochrome b subunit
MALFHVVPKATRRDPMAAWTNLHYAVLVLGTILAVCAFFFFVGHFKQRKRAAVSPCLTPLQTLPDAGIGVAEVASQ